VIDFIGLMGAGIVLYIGELDNILEDVDPAQLYRGHPFDPW
jgi:hypothetical protein